MKRVLVTGGRKYADRDHVFETLDALQPIEVVIHGAATGADSLARDWAISRGVEHDPHPARWDDLNGVPRSKIKMNVRTKRFYNVTAGFERNEEMLRKTCPTHVVAFPGDSGTNDMVHRTILARRHGQEVELLDLRESRK